MNRRTIIAAMSILAGYASAHAGGFTYFEDGNKLYRECSEGMGGIHYGFCLAFIQGVADAMQVSRFTSAQESCIPQHVQLGQVVDVTRAFLRDHPESRHKPAAALAIAAINDAFCPDDSLTVSRIPDQPQWKKVPQGPMPVKKPMKPLPLDTE
jgi:hypothetical protein